MLQPEFGGIKSRIEKTKSRADDVDLLTVKLMSCHLLRYKVYRR